MQGAGSPKPAAPAIQRQALDLFLELLELDADARDARLQALEQSDATLCSAVRELLGQLNEADLHPAVSPVAENDEKLPGDIGPWRLLRRIGQGGMGDVFLAERMDVDFRQQAALKRIWSGGASAILRFQRERQVLAKLEHPNIARLIDGGIDQEGRPWLAMEYVDGEAITQWCRRHKADLQQRVALFRQICDAVAFAHRNLVVHRDLKPSNILVDDHGRARLLDFGIARLLDADFVEATIALTPAWAAPEQLRGQPITTATDVYQLGILLRALLCGEAAAGATRPLDRRMSTSLAEAATSNASEAEVIASERQTTPKRLRALLRGDLDLIVRSATQRDPTLRYPSVDALSEDLRRWANHEPLHGVQTPLLTQVGKFLWRNRQAVAVATLLGAALVTASVFALLNARNERMQRQTAIAESERADVVLDYMQIMLGEASRPDSEHQVDLDAMVQASAVRVRQQYADNPVEGQKLLLMLADFYLGMSDDHGAKPVLDLVLNWPGIENSPDLHARAMSDMAVVAQKAGDPARAYALYGKAAAIWNANPKRYAVMRNSKLLTLAFLQTEDVKYKAAQATLRGMIEERVGKLELRDRVLATAYWQLAVTHIGLGELPQARKAVNEGLRILEELHLGHSSQAITLRDLLTSVELKSGEWAEAERIQRQVVMDQAALFGTDSSNYAGYALKLGRAIFNQGRQTEGLHWLEKVSDTARRRDQANGLLWVSTQLVLVDAYARAARLADARKALDEVDSAMLVKPELRKMLASELAEAQASLDAAQKTAKVKGGSGAAALLR